MCQLINRILLNGWNNFFIYKSLLGNPNIIIYNNIYNKK